MNIQIRYYSKSGNTQKVAKAIANTLSIEAKTIDTEMIYPVDILILGSAIYAGNISEEMQKFIRTLSKEKIKRVALFSTSVSKKSAIPIIKEILQETC